MKLQIKCNNRATRLLKAVHLRYSEKVTK